MPQNLQTNTQHLPCQSVSQALSKLLYKCEGFAKGCSKEEREKGVVWKPENGYIPRGMLGATGTIDEVQLILVLAEPGNPHEGDDYWLRENYGIKVSTSEDRERMFKAACEYTYKCYAKHKDTHHTNVRVILDLCFGSAIGFDTQLKHVWITESTLCSLPENQPESGGHMPVDISERCAILQINKQLNLFPNAMVALIGGKARTRAKYMNLLGKTVAKTESSSPTDRRPQKMRNTWRELASEFKEHQKTLKLLI